ncbi:ATP-binding protein [Nocardia sp. NPDC048505]|uniref:ATP-binding protein n=1 Tax=unclassified Nocardia TaxID=2637762 RepID=UPI0033C97939
MTTPEYQASYGREQSREFDLETTSNRWIRDAVRDLLAPADGPVVTDAVLGVDELVSNAREHTSPPWRCRLQRLADSSRLRVEIDDSSPADPEHREPDDSGGRGLLVLDQVAASWGVVHYGRFKTVWAEFPLDGPMAAQLGEPRLDQMILGSGSDDLSESGTADSEH